MLPASSHHLIIILAIFALSLVLLFTFLLYRRYRRYRHQRHARKTAQTILDAGFGPPGRGDRGDVINGQGGQYEPKG